MNRYILKHFHSNLYLVVLGIYVKDETSPGKVSMAGVLNSLNGLQSKQLNIPIYAQPEYENLPELLHGNHSARVEQILPAGMIINISCHLTTVLDFGCNAVVVSGLVRFYGPLLQVVNEDTWGFRTRGTAKVFYSDHYTPTPNKSVLSITGWDAFSRQRSPQETALLDKLHSSSIKQIIERTYDRMSMTEQYCDVVLKALGCVASVNNAEDVSYERDNARQYTFRFNMDLSKAELLYQIFPSYLQLRVAHDVPLGVTTVDRPTMVCFLDVGDEAELEKLVRYSLSSFLNKET